jgi:hypothetical protein
MTKEQAKNNILTVLRLKKIEEDILYKVDDINREKNRMTKDKERAQKNANDSVEYINKLTEEIDVLLEEYLMRTNFIEEKPKESECGEKGCVAMEDGACDDCGSSEPSDTPKDEVPASKALVNMKKNEEGKYEVN